MSPNHRQLTSVSYQLAVISLFTVHRSLFTEAAGGRA